MTNGKPLHYIGLSSVDSTNTWAKEHVAECAKEALTCIYAREQTAGRGRSGKHWLSPKDTNIYASYVFFLPKDFKALHNLGQILALSCVSTLKSLSLLPVIKWPNDILINRKKIAGILGELVELKDSYAAIVGIGVNVNMTSEMLARIDQPATSILALLSKPQDIMSILASLSQAFHSDLVRALREGFSPFYPQYNALLDRLGEEIRVENRGERLRGICLGIDTEGRLLLQSPGKEPMSIPQILTISSGEIS